MNRQTIVDYITSQANNRDCAPSEIVELPGPKTGIAWNSRHYYFDVEVTDNSVEFFLSPNRKDMDVVSITDIEGANEGILNTTLHTIFKRINETAENPKS